MKRFFLALVVLCGILAWTNPSQADHQRVFADNFKAENPVLGFLGLGKAASIFIGYDNYLLFSVGRMGEEPISVGVFGKVFTSRVPIESEIGKAFREALD